MYLYPEAAKQVGRNDSIPYYFHDEKDNMVFAPCQNYSSLYHYCSINTMMNIIRSKCLWLTNCQHSNDSQEMLWAINRLQEIFNDLKKSEVMNISSKEQLLEYIKNQKDNVSNFPYINNITVLSLFEQIEKNVIATPSEKIKPDSILNETMNFWSDYLFEDLKKNIFPTYISCFSSEKDNLGQWRGYGDDGRGIAIGFNINILDRLKDNDVFLRRVAYHENIQRMIIEKELFEYLSNPMNMKNWAYNILPVFKPFAFKEEQEWRLVFVPKENPTLKIDCYFKNGELKQCYTLPITDNFITEIILGPKCNVKREELILFFNFFGFKIDDKQIINSNLSYR